MSKSKGNVINPLDLTAKYGTDAFRMGLIVGNTPGTSLALSEDKIKAYQHFANKVWNASKFVMQNTEDVDLSKQPELTEEDQKALDELQAISEDITKDIENFRLYLAAEKLYQYFWHSFADVIIEREKLVLRGDDNNAKASAQWTLHTILAACLKLLHPFCPFVTEEVWQHLSTPNKQTTLMVEQWPV